MFRKWHTKRMSGYQEIRMQIIRKSEYQVVAENTRNVLIPRYPDIHCLIP